MENKVEIRIVLDNDDPDTINAAIEAIKDRVNRMGCTSGCVEGDNYTVDFWRH